MMVCVYRITAKVLVNFDKAKHADVLLKVINCFHF